MVKHGKTLSFAQGSAKRRRFRTYSKRSPPVANWQKKSFRHGMQYSAHVGHVSSCLSDLCRLSMTTCDMKCSSCISGLHDQSNLWWSFHHLNEKTWSWDPPWIGRLANVASLEHVFVRNVPRCVYVPRLIQSQRKKMQRWKMLFILKNWTSSLELLILVWQSLLLKHFKTIS